MSKKRHELSDEEWPQLGAFLPPQKPKTGRPSLDHRRVSNGMIWILRTGAPWRDLPERYGKWQTGARRFYRWQKNGGWDRSFAQLQQRKEAVGPLDWEVHYVDGSVIRAHQPAAGAEQSPYGKKAPLKLKCRA